MNRTLAFFLVGVLSGTAAASAQNPPELGTVQHDTAIAVPRLKAAEVPPSTKQFDAPASQTSSRRPFIKNLTVESFGYNRQSVGPGFENPIQLSYDALTAHGLECPRCVPRPVMDRPKYALPPFGTNAALTFGRAQLFSQFGGVNAWRADNVLKDIRSKNDWRASSSNDAWLMQGAAGTRFSVDRNQHIWLGTAGRYFENLGGGKRHWNSLGGSATFLFGR